MAQYKRNELASSKIEWTASNGKIITVTQVLSEMLTDYFGDGDWSRTAHGLSIDVVAAVDGKIVSPGAWVQSLPAGRADGLIAKIGIVGLNAERLAAVNAARAEVESHPVWQAHLAQIAAADQIANQRAAAERRLDNTMTLNGHSF